MSTTAYSISSKSFYMYTCAHFNQKHTRFIIIVTLIKSHFRSGLIVDSARNAFICTCINFIYFHVHAMRTHDSVWCTRVRPSAVSLFNRVFGEREICGEEEEEGYVGKTLCPARHLFLCLLICTRLWLGTCYPDRWNVVCVLLYS